VLLKDLNQKSLILDGGTNRSFMLPWH